MTEFQPEIKTISKKKLVGQRLKMSLAENKTQQLWHSFMKRRTEIGNTVSSKLYSLQYYPESYFEAFNPASVFEKWALIEVSDFNDIPNNLESFILPGGLYGVFYYHGAANDAASVFQYIFEKWLPNSIYQLDNRPHFEILGEKYKKDDPDSEEEIWVPIKKLY